LTYDLPRTAVPYTPPDGPHAAGSLAAAGREAWRWRETPRCSSLSAIMVVAEEHMKIEAKLAEMGLTLPISPKPVGNYVRAVRTGNLLYTAGHGPSRGGKNQFVGKLGKDLTVEDGYKSAQLVCLNCLASIKEALGDLDRVKRVVKVLGMVNATPEFGDQPKVINGASDLLVNLYGDAGRHARSAVGMGSLPGGISVEIEMILEVE
jgi:enamine deaminase RidA (YjgF/YER057c/UK114 family)